MTEYAIDIKNISKSFKKEMVLKDVSLQIEQGKIYGIIGRNGSGKTVLFKCICGLLLVDCGTIQVDRQQIGAIIEEPGFLKQYTGRRNLQFLASLKSEKGIDFDAILKTVGLSESADKKVSKYSMGMRQRLGIAQAIMENQRILILDEPMNDLDNQGVNEMRSLLLELRLQGKTILIASHNREDIGLLCDKVYTMDHGTLQVV